MDIETIRMLVNAVDCLNAASEGTHDDFVDHHIDRATVEIAKAIREATHGSE